MTVHRDERGEPCTHHPDASDEGIYTLAALGSRLARLERSDSPFHQPPRIAGRVHWVRPVLVEQVGFQEWTTAGLLRQPRFLGLREDKAAADVVRERAAS